MVFAPSPKSNPSLPTKALGPRANAYVIHTRVYRTKQEWSLSFLVATSPDAKFFR